MGWLIALAVLAGVALLPVGIRGIYRESEACLWLLIGPFKFRLYPAKPKEKKETAQPKEKRAGRSPKGGSWQDFLPVTRTVLDFLNQLRKKVGVKNLELKLILAGDDPADLAIHYGQAWAALGNLMPQLDRVLTIRKKDVEVECDFTAETTRIYARVDATVSVARALHLGGRYGVKLIKDILKLKKLREGGAEL